MNSKFNTSKLDQIIRDRLVKLEKERQFLLDKTVTWLDKFGTKYGIKKAYIFGSVTKQNKFTESSDIDIAVEQINPEDFFFVISIVSEYLEREVDIIVLNKCHFAHRIMETGILWTPIP